MFFQIFRRNKQPAALGDVHHVQGDHQWAAQLDELADEIEIALKVAGINDDDDERLTLSSTGEFKAEVLTEEENEWRPLASAEELVEYYDPTDVFGDLADALAEAYPSIAPELNAETGATNGTGPDGTTDGDEESDKDADDDDEASDAADEEGAPRA